MSFEYDTWIKAVSEVRLVDHRTNSATLIPEKIKQVTITVPAWAATSMDHKCSSCGWPVYIINVGSSHYHYCTNPECYHSSSFKSIIDSLQHHDQIEWERQERTRKRKAEAERKAEESRKLDLLIENRIRRILFSYGVRVRKAPRRVKT